MFLQVEAEPHIFITGIDSDGFFAMSFSPPGNGDLVLTRNWLTTLETDRQRIHVLQNEICQIIGLRHPFFTKNFAIQHHLDEAISQREKDLILEIYGLNQNKIDCENLIRLAPSNKTKIF